MTRKLCSGLALAVLTLVLPAVSAGALLVCALAVLAPEAASALPITTRVDVATSGAEANAGVVSAPYGDVAVSADGRWVVFVSASSNLVAGDTNDVRDVFLRDRVMAQTTRLSVAASGAQANADSAGPVAISGDGRFVVFQTESSNLAPGTSLGFPFTVVLDRSTGVMHSPGQLGLQWPAQVAISDDGRYLAYDSIQKDWTDVVRRDRATGHSATINALLGARFSENRLGGMSADGNRVFLSARATDPTRRFGLFVRDFRAGWTRRVDVNNGGRAENRLGTADAISADGHYVLFSSPATNLIRGDTNGAWDVFARSIDIGRTGRLSTSTSETQADAGSRGLAISGNGRYRLFQSIATNLVGTDTNQARDIFIRDLATATTQRCSITSTGQQANDESGEPAGSRSSPPPSGTLSRNGQAALFPSTATNLIPNDTNNHDDLISRGPTC